MGNPDLSSHQEQQSDQGEYLSERKVIPLEDFVIETDAEEVQAVTIGTLIDADATTKKPEKACLKWCDGKPRPWVEKCTWDHCGACSKCDELPTRKRTTTSTDSTVAEVTKAAPTEAEVTKAEVTEATIGSVIIAETTEAEAKTESVATIKSVTTIKSVATIK